MLVHGSDLREFAGLAFRRALESPPARQALL
jgi:hypothetical protein